MGNLLSLMGKGMSLTIEKKCVNANIDKLLNTWGRRKKSFMFF
jgi:hypothetical protein